MQNQQITLQKSESGIYFLYNLWQKSQVFPKNAKLFLSFFTCLHLLLPNDKNLKGDSGDFNLFIMVQGVHLG